MREINGVNYIIGSEKEFDFKGAIRTSIKVRLPKGKKMIIITRYEDGTYSEPVATPFKANF